MLKVLFINICLFAITFSFISCSDDEPEPTDYKTLQKYADCVDYNVTVDSFNLSYIRATVSDTTYKLISGFDGLDILGVLKLNIDEYALFIRAIFKKENGDTLQYYYVDKGQFTEELDTIFPYYYEPRPDPIFYERVGRYTFTDTLAPINSFTAKYRKDCSDSALTLEFAIDSTDFFAIFHRSS